MLHIWYIKVLAALAVRTPYVLSTTCHPFYSRPCLFHHPKLRFPCSLLLLHKIKSRVVLLLNFDLFTLCGKVLSFFCISPSAKGLI
jgi:hypothetical protein